MAMAEHAASSSDKVFCERCRVLIWKPMMRLNKHQIKQLSREYVVHPDLPPVNVARKRTRRECSFYGPWSISYFLD